MRNSGTPADPYDVIGLGFGPSNLALAIAAQEIAPDRTCLFLERRPGIRWHEGMLIDGARMQISFLKDLVSLRNLASPFTFLAYTKAKGRLEKFVNLGEFRPTRLEFQDYLRWVADQFADRVRYRTEVTSVEPVSDADGGHSLWRVTASDTASGEEITYYGRNVVHALGGRPRLPDGVSLGPSIVHSSGFLPHFPGRFEDCGRGYEFGVVGAGQSAGEIAAYLLERYREARVHLVIPGWSLRATDNNPFGNEQFFESNAADFYACDEDARAAYADELRLANYGVVEEGSLAELYRMTYADEIRGRPRLVIHRGSRLVRADDDGAGVTAGIADRRGDSSAELRLDGLVLATGYNRGLDPRMYAATLPFLETGGDGAVRVTRDNRVRAAEELTCGLYVQGFAESQQGLGDTLLSLLPFRSKQIVTAIAKDGPPLARGWAAATAAHYPPPHYLEHDTDKMYALIERYSFATLVSAVDGGYPMVTHLPLVLDRSRGREGMLLGHLHRANPQVPLLDGGKVLVVFHGPNAFISPNLFTADQLPTWNSMSVHVRGHAVLTSDRTRLLAQMSRVCETADPDPDGYRLDPAHPSVDWLIDYVVGVEIEIEELRGRFKLSQELDDHDRGLAVSELVRDTGDAARDLVERVTGLPVTASRTPAAPAGNGSLAALRASRTDKERQS